MKRKETNKSLEIGCETYGDKKTGAYKYDRQPKQTLKVHGTYRWSKCKGKDLKRMRTYLAKRKGSIEPVVTGIFLVIRRRIVGEPMFPRDTSPGAAGFSYPSESSFLELRKLHGIEAGPVERA
jgi:hypothetical protein